MSKPIESIGHSAPGALSEVIALGLTPTNRTAIDTIWLNEFERHT